MIAIDQTIFGAGTGNCFAACVASLLELPLADVPNFCAGYTDGSWYPPYREWLAKRGFIDLSLNWGDWVTDVGGMGDVIFIVSGPGPRGCDHSTLYQHGKLLHDPHPSRDGLLKASEINILIPTRLCGWKLTLPPEPEEGDELAIGDSP